MLYYHLWFISYWLKIHFFKIDFAFIFSLLWHDYIQQFVPKKCVHFILYGCQIFNHSLQCRKFILNIFQCFWQHTSLKAKIKSNILFFKLLTYLFFFEKTSVKALGCCGLIILGFILGIDQEKGLGTLSFSGVNDLFIFKFDITILNNF